MRWACLCVPVSFFYFWCYCRLAFALSLAHTHTLDWSECACACSFDGFTYLIVWDYQPRNWKHRIERNVVVVVCVLSIHSYGFAYIVQVCDGIVFNRQPWSRLCFELWYLSNEILIENDDTLLYARWRYKHTKKAFML